VVDPVDGEQLAEFDVEADLLQRLAARALAGCLAVVGLDRAARKAQPSR
jgi:hypothetical protein